MRFSSHALLYSIIAGMCFFLCFFLAFTNSKGKKFPLAYYNITVLCYNIVYFLSHTGITRKES